MASLMQLHFWVSCLAITVEHLVVSPLDMFYTVADELWLLLVRT